MNENPTIGDNPAILDIHVVQGSTQEVVLAFRDDAGEPLNLMSYTPRLQIKPTQSLDAPAVATKTLGSGLAIDAHVLTIHFGIETEAWKGESYYYDLLLVNGSNRSHKIKGKIFVHQSVTS